ncbi:uncharacterized protein LOC127244436 [Andrographis paniculata]|uniref:uncharacterized protein LOC127244436 n=1 Tax=Andrographis paniculata TaxID=175694 RepID=UPI0021E8D1A5|nr:uncharacterized protein LOC127244436 [Andrographis paniculata]
MVDSLIVLRIKKVPYPSPYESSADNGVMTFNRHLQCLFRDNWSPIPLTAKMQWKFISGFDIVMGKSQRGAVGGSQDPAVSPARRFTRASARNSPLEATHPASRNPSPIRNPTKKVTKRKGSRVSPLLQRLRSITSEWEKERDARGQSMKPTSSTRRAVLQDSEGPLEEHDDRDVPSVQCLI